MSSYCALRSRNGTPCIAHSLARNRETRCLSPHFPISLVGQGASAEDFQRTGAGWSVEGNSRHLVGCPAVVVLDAVAAAAIPVVRRGAIFSQKVLVNVVVPDFGD